MIKLKNNAKPIQAGIELPGSKSLSNRALIIRALSGLDIQFRNLSDSEDTVLLAKALGKIKGRSSASIDIHHAGTDMRFLTAFLSCKEGSWEITGSERMQQRPIAELVNALRELGADITYMGNEGYPPLFIKGKKLAGGNIKINGSISSQFISALLLVAPTFKNGLTLEINGEIVSQPYIRMTTELLSQFGAKLTVSGNIISVTASGFTFNSSEFFIESDWSAASYWYSIAALSPDSEICLTALSQESLQADAILPELFKKFGVITEFKQDKMYLKSSGTSLKDFAFDFTNCPDIAQTVAVTCLGLGIKARLRGLKTLKIKETDRILALKNELEKFGATVLITNDSIELEPPDHLISPTSPICTYSDHRMAMSFSPLTIKAKQLTIEDPDVVNKSYPGYWDDLVLAGFEIM